MIVSVVRTGIDQVSTVGLRRVVKHIGEGKEVLLTGAIVDERGVG